MTYLREVDMGPLREETARLQAEMPRRKPRRDASQDERGGKDLRPGAGSVKPLWRRWLAWTGILTLLVGLPWLLGVCAAGPFLLLDAETPSGVSDRIEAVRAAEAPPWITRALVRDMED